MKRNLLRLVEHELNLKKQDLAKFELSRDVSKAVNPLHPKFTPALKEQIEQQLIEDSIMARLLGQESQLDIIDKFLLERKNNALAKALDERLGKNYLQNYTP